MAANVVFYDGKKDLEALRSAFPAAEFRYVKSAPPPETLRACAGSAVVFALANEALAAAAENCRGLGLPEVSVLPTGAELVPVKIDVSKPRLDYMETEIVRVCNLNCRGCCDFMNIVRGEDKFYDFSRCCADLERLKELFWGIGKIRLMGGEPLLNPRLADYAEAARRIFPDSDLRIVTNGLLLPGLSPDILARIKNTRCSFDISQYPPTQKKKQQIKAVLDAAGVAYNFSVPMRFFFRNLRARPAEDPAPAFNNCIFTHCHMLGDGRLAPCSYAYCAYRFNRHFGEVYPENDLFDLSDPSLDGWRILEAFRRPHPFCSCCGSGVIPFRWEGHCGPSDARESDWQIRDTFIYTKLAPVLQSAAKKGAVRLRARIQKKHSPQ